MSDEVLGSLQVNFLADLQNMLSAESQFKNIIDSIVSAAQSLSGDLQDLPGLNAENLVQNVAGATEQLDQLATTGTEVSDELQSLQGVNAENLTGGALSGEEALQSLAGESVQAAEDLQKVASEGSAAGKSLAGDFAPKVKEGGESLFQMASRVAFGIMNLKNMGQMAVSVASSLLGPARAAETMKTAFINLLGSTKAATKEMQDLDTFASKTPYTTMDIDKAAAQMVGFGFSAKQVVPDLTAIGDALSAVGRGSSAELDSVVNIFGKMRMEGKLTGGTMMELSRNGINAWKILEDQTGKTHAVLAKMVSGGLIPADQAISMLTKGIEKNPLYAGGMAKQSATLTGILSTLKSNWDQMLASFGTPIINEIEGGLTNLGTALASPAFKGFASLLGGAIAGALHLVGDALGGVMKGVSLLQDAFHSEAGHIFGLQMQFIGQNLHLIMNLFHNAAQIVDHVFGASMENTGNKAKTSFIPALQAVDNFLQTLNQDLGAAHDFIYDLVTSSSLDGVTGLASSLQGELMPAVKNVSDWFNTQLMPAIDSLGGPLDHIANVIFTTLIPAMAKIEAVRLDTIIKVFSDFAPLVGKIIPPLIQFAGVLIDNVASAIEFVTPYLADAVDAVSVFVGALADRLAPIAMMVFDIISQKIRDFSVFWGDVWPGIANILEGVWKYISGVIQIAWSLVSGIILIGLDILSGKWGNIWGDMKNMLSGIWEGIKKMVFGALQALLGIMETAAGGLIFALTQPFVQARDTIMGIWNDIKGVFGQADAQQAANNVVAQAPHRLAGPILPGNHALDIQGPFLPGNQQSFTFGPHIPGYATGTDFAPGGTSMVGEHGPEIVNLPRGAQVIPLQGGAHSAIAAAGASIAMQHISFIVDSRTLASIVGPAMVKEKYLKLGA